jgi:hypothetical protein
MATTPKGKKPKPQIGSKRPDPYSYPVPVDMVRVAESSEDIAMSVLGWIFAVILVALMLPLLAFLYLDVLTQKAEVKQQTEKVEKLRREIERKNRDKTPDSIDDNPVFDRLRRPIQIPMSRPDKLE